MASSLGVRLGLLVVLAVQNAGQTVLIKLAQTQGSRPDSLVVMLLSELTKAVASLALFFAVEADASWKQHFTLIAAKRSMKLVPTAFLFALQNQLLFVGVHNLDPPVFQALSQSKLIAAGVFSVVLLDKRLTQVQWAALLLLACGAALVQLENMLCPDVETAARSAHDPVKGFVAVLCTSVLSGLAGCYTELMLKTHKMPMWLQSAQVAWASAILLVFMVFSQRLSSSVDGRQMELADLFDGFILATWAVVATLSLGGLVVVAVLRYADNVLKGMSMVFALLLSGVLSALLFRSKIGAVFCVASIIICSSVFLYQHTPPPPQLPMKAKASNSNGESSPANS
mmetsp:Transcript_47925/g.145750  ORF Transcript_47925/g.145750 Transcript_47925/m.145750 type:complete len:341 (-) Transcript_47925:31-1053(-)